jgi:DNA-binding GntR family transcriptional regulator
MIRPAYQNKNQIVHNILLDAIVRGEYRPDTRLVIDDLAARLDVSQIPIREALRQLEADGFVSFEPHVGFRVTPIHAGLVAEVFALLEAMETISSRQACQHMTDEQLNTLEDHIRAMDASVDQPALWSKQNKDLHQFISACAQMPLVMRMMQKALGHWERLQLHYFRDVFSHRIQIAQDDHWRLLEAFRSRNPERVEQVVRDHNRSALDAYLGHLAHSDPG